MNFDLIAETSLETLSGNIGRLLVGLVVLAVIVIVGVLFASLAVDPDSGSDVGDVRKRADRRCGD